MIDVLLGWLAQGLWPLPWWGVALFALAVTHVTIASVTIFLHRHQAHRALTLHPVVSHFFRFWLWLTTGMVTREWVSIHRKHHARCETPDDPHSPAVLGIETVLWRGAELYRREAENTQTLERYGQGTPDDWLERNVYAAHPALGIVLMLGIDVALFGALGLTVWAVQMVWIPFWAAGVINGLGHWWGYRNFESQDRSTNISPIGLLIGGEELHNNHHAFPASAKLSARPWEFDIGWAYIRLLSMLGLAEVRRVAPRPVIVPEKQVIDMDTVRAVLKNKFHVTANYAREVMVPVLREEWRRGDASCRRLLKRARALLVRERTQLDADAQGRLDRVLSLNERLKTVYEFRQQLAAIWSRKTAGSENLLEALQGWCARAEASGIEALQNFARSLRGYSLQAVASSQ